MRELVNSLSSQARSDAVQFAASELARAELRVRGARQAMLDFRVAHNDFDPTATATAALGLVAQLEGERSKLNSRSRLRRRLPLPRRPAGAGDEGQDRRASRRRSPACRGRSRMAPPPASPSPASPPPPAPPPAAPPPTPALASLVGDYQGVLLDQEFAEKSYAAAQASLERARAEADRTQSYLAIYMNPAIADSAARPRRPLAIFIVFTFAAIIWAVAALIALTVKDHMP